MIEVTIQCSDGPMVLRFRTLQEATERIGAANLETLRRWVASLEEICREKGGDL